MSDLTGSEIEPKTFRNGSDVLNQYANRPDLFFNISKFSVTVTSTKVIGWKEADRDMVCSVSLMAAFMKDNGGQICSMVKVWD